MGRDTPRTGERERSMAVAADDQDNGGNRRIAKRLFWCGMGLAPVAAMLVMLADGSALLRMGVVLALIIVVFVGISAVHLQQRAGAGAVAPEVEDLVFDEIDGLRTDVRADITHAAQVTHRALSEKINAVSDNLEALRGQVDTLRERTDQRADRGRHQPDPVTPDVPARPSPGGLLHHTETVQVTTRKTTVVDPAEATREAPGTVYAPRRAPVAEDDAGPARGVGDIDRHAGRIVRDEPAGWGRVPRQRPRPDREELPAIAAAPEGGQVSWTEQLRGGPREESRERVPADLPAPRRRPPVPREDEPQGEAITGMRSGDRWASVRRDEYGRELRMGERRAEYRTDEAGSEYRVADRWASVRRAEPEDQGDYGSDDTDRLERCAGWDSDGGAPSGRSRHRSGPAASVTRPERHPEDAGPRDSGAGRHGGGQDRHPGRHDDGTDHRRGTSSGRHGGSQERHGGGPERHGGSQERHGGSPGRHGDSPDRDGDRRDQDDAARYQDSHHYADSGEYGMPIRREQRVVHRQGDHGYEGANRGDVVAPGGYGERPRSRRSRSLDGSPDHGEDYRRGDAREYRDHDRGSDRDRVGDHGRARDDRGRGRDRDRDDDDRDYRDRGRDRW